MKSLIVYWFKWQARKSGEKILIQYFNKTEIKLILKQYWKRYLLLKTDTPKMPSIGGGIMIQLAAMSTAIYEELISRGIDKKKATKIFYDIAWSIYTKMGAYTW